MKQVVLLGSLILAGIFAIRPVLAQGAPPPAPAPALAASATPQVGYFPQLPPSRPCKAANLRGLWRWIQVYENPVGNATAAFRAMPYQYATFGASSLYIEHQSQNAQTNADVMRDILRKSGTDQYVLTDTGFIFFYRNGAVVDTMACFIVANRVEPFSVGQMLLMPPQTEGMTSRMVKVYQKMHLPKPAKKKKKGKRR